MIDYLVGKCPQQVALCGVIVCVQPVFFAPKTSGNGKGRIVRLRAHLRLTFFKIFNQEKTLNNYIVEIAFACFHNNKMH